MSGRWSCSCLCQRTRSTARQCVRTVVLLLPLPTDEEGGGAVCQDGGPAPASANGRGGGRGSVSGRWSCSCLCQQTRSTAMQCVRTVVLLLPLPADEEHGEAVCQDGGPAPASANGREGRRGSVSGRWSCSCLCQRTRSTARQCVRTVVLLLPLPADEEHGEAVCQDGGPAPASANGRGGWRGSVSGRWSCSCLCQRMRSMAGQCVRTMVLPLPLPADGEHCVAVCLILALG